MSASITFENDHRGAVVACNKVLSGQDFIETNNALYNSPTIFDLQYCITILDDIESVEITTEQLSFIAQQDAEGALKTAHKKLFIALVISNDIVEGIARLYQHYIDSDKVVVKTFKTLNSARAWIDSVIVDSAVTSI